jgi:3-hydroxyethyl bacteriochlorophyllide a dehydrogenase
MNYPTFKAVVIPEKGRAEIRELPSRELKPHEVRVANTVTAASVGTEYLVVSGQLHGCKYPCLIGYQGVGRIVELGAEVTGYKIGDRVCSGQSDYFPDGYSSGCGNAHVSHIIVSDKGDFEQAELVRVPDGVSDEEAAYAWLGAVSMQGVRRANVTSNDVVAVVGLGVVGQFAAQICRARGAKVYACDLISERAALAAKLSADVVVTGDTAALDKRLRADHKGGANVVIECTGNTKVVDAAMELAAMEGRFVFQGHYPGMVSYRFIPPHWRRLTLFCPCAWGPLPPILDLMRQKKMTVRPMIEGIYTPEQASELYARIYQRDPRIAAAAIRWSN